MTRRPTATALQDIEMSKKPVIPKVRSNTADKGDRGDTSPRTLGTIQEISVFRDKKGKEIRTQGPVKPLKGRRIGRNEFEG